MPRQELQRLSNDLGETTVPVPSQLLGLLPQPPAAGWPETFELARIAQKLEEKYNELEPYYNLVGRGEDKAGSPAATRAQSYVPADPAYAPRKRAERFSWLIWVLIGDQKVGVNSFSGSPYQALIEAHGTAERLRLALRKMREVKEALKD